MTVVRKGDANHSSSDAVEAWGLATPSLGAQELVVCRVQSSPGRVSRLHSHDREEVVVVLRGAAIAELDGRGVQLGPGDTLIIPSGTAHTFITGESEPFECLTFEPLGIRFFDAEGNEYAPPEVMR